MIPGIIATISTSAELLLTKLLLRGGKSHSEKYVTLHFLWTVVFMIPLLYFFFSMDLSKVEPYHYFVFTILLISAGIYNALQFKCIRRIRIEHSQPILLTSWVFTIILGFFFIPGEGSIIKLGLALIACLSVIVASLNPRTFKTKKYELLLFGAAFFIGIYNLTSKIMLDIMSPFALYFVRTLLLLPVFIVMFKFNNKDLTKGHLRIAIISAISILAQTTTFWAYKTIGLVTTSLLMTLAPLITLLGARVFLKEKVKWKYIIATFVVIVCIVTSLLV